MTVIVIVTAHGPNFILVKNMWSIIRPKKNYLEDASRRPLTK